MLRYFNKDIAMLGTEALTYRRLGVLLKALPRESLVVREISGPVAEWSQLEHLMATMVDELRGLCYAYVSAHSGKGKKPPKPNPIVRPGMDRTKKKQTKMSLSEMKQKLHGTQWVDAGVDRTVR